MSPITGKSLAITRAQLEVSSSSCSGPPLDGLGKQSNNHKDTVKIYSERIESEYGFDDAEAEAEAEAEGDDAEAEEDEGVEEDEQTDQ